ncbi:nicotinate-nucleotide adenylyltransferase [Poritiphilus flavus]|uniref:Nicotinate-nucleotide adenylyltransferase n=1 Tax=Poritiphilus flavus TaxID=2697053 RepID=A0A6L9E7U1_9FLAO|nr:nicotinate-nucleotide adenylyltransferase [Poritiphilus flavus]NAS10807.1 nicotinate-nucleotide adenylyltransferase [Poritiphilus flavus]
MKRLVLYTLALGFTAQVLSQEVKTEVLTEVVVMAVNYKYLDQTDNTEAAIPVKRLRKEVATFDVQDAEFYQDDYEFYTVNFYIPDGKIVAVYDQEGKILRTIEKFRDMKLPKAVGKAVQKRFPEWEVIGEVYRVSYNHEDGATQSYKLKLRNGDEILRVKVNEKGEFQ